MLQLMHPSIAGTLLKDALGVSGKPAASRASIDAAIGWLCAAQDQCEGKGVSAGYSLKRGWLPPYPETTGYIIPTFYDYADLTGDDGYRRRARAMAAWECDVQLDNGAVMGGVYRGKDAEAGPVAFNTGQVLLGWVREIAESGDERVVNAATRAGDWLLAAQSEDGAWRIPGVETETLEHAYDVRTGWSLLELGRSLDRDDYLEAGIRNVEWALRQENDTGWYANNAFFSESRWTMTFTHTIAYVMEGLLGAWHIIEDPRCLEAVKRTADKLLRILELRRFMWGDFDENWKSSEKKYSCLTGNAQISGVWLQLFEITRDSRFLSAALKLNDFVKSTQNINAWHPGIRGGIKGSQPIWGAYTRYVYPNWAAKFLVDSLLREEQSMARFEAAVRSGENLSPTGPIETVNSPH